MNPSRLSSLRLPNMRQLSAALLLLLLAPLLSSCGSVRQDDSLSLMLYSYASLIRWGDFEGAWDQVDPEYREKHPLSPLDLERFAQIQVAGYRTSGPVPLPDGTVAQAVEIEIVNIHTQSPRNVVDSQIWRWDETAKRWWLTTGLPNITR